MYANVKSIIRDLALIIIGGLIGAYSAAELYCDLAHYTNMDPLLISILWAVKFATLGLPGLICIYFAISIYAKISEYPSSVFLLGLLWSFFLVILTWGYNKSSIPRSTLFSLAVVILSHALTGLLVFLYTLALGKTARRDSSG
jgi:phage shock protein PspC (stress-responsive transcriptional regulator)